MSIKNKLIIILLLTVAILTAYTALIAWGIINNKNHLMNVNDAMDDIYALSQIRANINRHIKEEIDLNASERLKDKRESNKFRNKAKQAINDFIEAEHESVRRGRIIDKLHLEMALEIRNTYNSIADKIALFYFQEDNEELLNSPPLDHEAFESMLEDNIFKKLDLILEDEIKDILNGYNETLLNIGFIYWGIEESKKQVAIARKAFDYFIAVHQTRSNINEQIHAVLDFILFGEEDYKEVLDETEVRTKIYFNNWKSALESHMDVGLEGEEEDMDNLIAIQKQYRQFTHYLNEAVQLVEVGKKKLLFELMEDKIEPLMDNFLLPGLEKASLDSMAEIANSHSELTRLTTKAGLNIFAIVLTVFLAVVLISLRLIKGILKTEEELQELNKHLEERVEEEIVKKREKEQMLLQQSRIASMGEMIGAIAHQWRQPLNALGIIIQDIKDAYAFEQLDRKYIDNSVKESMEQIQFMSKTIDDFRNFYRPSKEKEAFTVFEAIQSAISLQEAQLIQNEINITINTEAENKLNVIGYPNEFKQVVLNIISNARSAILEAREEGLISKESCVILINISLEGERAVIRISNNGKSIPKDIIGRIFEPYFTTKNVAEGTGIGLYMSKVIIEKNMGGKLYVNNTNSGVTFTIELIIS